MSTTVLILAKREPGGFRFARRAQLDLLHRSLLRHWPGQDVHVLGEPAGPGFQEWVLELVARASDHICFMTDDGLLIRNVDSTPAWALDADPSIICWSLRYGANTVRSYAMDAPLVWDGPIWDWRRAAADFGYPGSVDGHIFRSSDVGDWLAGIGRAFENPTALECLLDHACRNLADRWRMASYPESRYVGVPVNRVSEQSGVRFGQRFPQPAGQLNRRFDGGERISLDRLEADLGWVDGPHAELEFPWE